MSNPVVFFDMTIGGAAAGRIEMTLRADVSSCSAAKRTVQANRMFGVSRHLPVTLARHHTQRALPFAHRFATCRRHSTGRSEDRRELPCAVHRREGLRLQGLGLPPGHHAVHVPGETLPLPLCVSTAFS